MPWIFLKQLINMKGWRKKTKMCTGHEHGTAEPLFGAFRSYAPLRYRPFLRKRDCQKAAFYRVVRCSSCKNSILLCFFWNMCSLLMFFALPCFCMDFEVMKYPHFVTTIVSTKFSHFPVHRRYSEYSQALSLLAMSALRVGLLGQGWLTAPFWLKHSASIASMAKRQDQAWQMLLWQHKIWLQSEWPPTTRTFDHCQLLFSNMWSRLE